MDDLQSALQQLLGRSAAARGAGLDGVSARLHPPEGRPAAPAAAETAGTGRSKAARCAAAAGRAKGRPCRPGDRREKLLMALRPFLKPERQEKLDRALRIAQLTQLAGSAFSGHKHL